MIHQVFRYFCMIFCLFIGNQIYAQDLVKSIDFKNNAQFLSIDNQSNIYVKDNANLLTKYSPDGDSLMQYRSIKNGQIAGIDALSGLRIYTFYKQQGTVVILDRNLTEKNSIQLRKLNIYNISNIGASQDGSMWVYDFDNAQLIKVDEQLNIQQKSDDTRLVTRLVIHPDQIIENDRQVFIIDNKQGVFHFDQYGTFVNHYLIPSDQIFQITNQTIIYLKDNTLHSYNLKNSSTGSIPLNTFIKDGNEPILDIKISNTNYYILYNSHLDIYKQ